MSTLFTKIIEGEIPGRFVYKDQNCVAFLTIEPLSKGHMLIVPREEVPYWLDLDDDTRDHLFAVAQTMGRLLKETYGYSHIGLQIAGFDVPHTHIHIAGASSAADMAFSNAKAASDEELDQVLADLTKEK